MKGGIVAWFYIIGVILIFFMAILVAFKTVDITKSPEVGAAKLSTSIPLYINVLSAVDEGSVSIKADRRYDIEIDHKGIIGVFRRKGHYLIVTPYKEVSVHDPTGGTEKKIEKGEEEAVFILSYPEKKYESLLKKFSVSADESICVEKTLNNKYPEVSKC